MTTIGEAIQAYKELYGDTQSGIEALALALQIILEHTLDGIEIGGQPLSQNEVYQNAQQGNWNSFQEAQSIVADRGHYTFGIYIVRQALEESLSPDRCAFVTIGGKSVSKHEVYQRLDREERELLAEIRQKLEATEPFHKPDQVAYEVAVDRGGW